MPPSYTPLAGNTGRFRTSFPIPEFGRIEFPFPWSAANQQAAQQAFKPPKHFEFARINRIRLKCSAVPLGERIEENYFVKTTPIAVRDQLLLGCKRNPAGLPHWYLHNYPGFSSGIGRLRLLVMLLIDCRSMFSSVSRTANNEHKPAKSAGAVNGRVFFI